jgi:YVTN family beta-propeller protein
LATLLILQPAVFARTEIKIAVGRNPDFVAVNSATNMIYSSNSTQGTVSVIDGATNTPAATISVGGFPQGIAVNPGHEPDLRCAVQRSLQHRFRN